MALFYFDTSALVKLYVPESGSQWTKEIVDERAKSGERTNLIFSSKIGIIETAAAIALRARTGDISENTQRELYKDFLKHSENLFAHLTTTDEIISKASSLTQDYPVRGYDAVHLATAMDLNARLLTNQLPELTFVSADEKLTQAANEEELQTEDPSKHE